MEIKSHDYEWFFEKIARIQRDKEELRNALKEEDKDTFLGTKISENNFGLVAAIAAGVDIKCLNSTFCFKMADYFSETERSVRQETDVEPLASRFLNDTMKEAVVNLT